MVAAAAVCGGGLAASQIASARPAAATLSVSASKTKLAFSKKSLSARHGRITLRMSNPSSNRHSIAIKGKAKGKVVGKGGVSTVTATLKKGRYTFYCTVPGHEAGGMKGTLTVS